MVMGFFNSKPFMRPVPSKLQIFLLNLICFFLFFLGRYALLCLHENRCCFGLQARGVKLKRKEKGLVTLLAIEQ